MAAFFSHDASNILLGELERRGKKNREVVQRDFRMFRFLYFRWTMIFPDQL